MSTHNICLYKEIAKKHTGCNLKIMALLDCALTVIRFYSPVNPLGTCRVSLVYLTILLLGRLLESGGANDHRKYFMINFHERMLPTQRGSNLQTTSSPVRVSIG